MDDAATTRLFLAQSQRNGSDETARHEASWGQSALGGQVREGENADRDQGRQDQGNRQPLPRHLDQRRPLIRLPFQTPARVRQRPCGLPAQLDITKVTLATRGSLEREPRPHRPLVGLSEYRLAIDPEQEPFLVALQTDRMPNRRRRVTPSTSRWTEWGTSRRWPTTCVSARVARSARTSRVRTN